MFGLHILDLSMLLLYLMGIMFAGLWTARKLKASATITWVVGALARLL